MGDTMREKTGNKKPFGQIAPPFYKITEVYVLPCLNQTALYKVAAQIAPFQATKYDNLAIPGR